MIKNKVYCLLMLIFIISYTFFTGNSLTCDKNNNICIVKSLLRNNAIDSFKYNNIYAVECTQRGRFYTLQIREKTELRNNIYEFGQEHQTLEYSSNHLCQNALKKLIKYKNSSDIILKMRGFHSSIIEVLLLGLLVFLIISIKDAITLKKYKNKAIKLDETKLKQTK